MIDEQSIPKVREGVEAVAIGDELLVLGGDHGASVLGGTGRAMWLCIDGSASLGDIADELSDVFGVARAEVRDELLPFVRQLVVAGLLSSPPGWDGRGSVTRAERPEAFTAGQLLPVPDLVDAEGAPAELDVRVGRTALVVTWDPRCRYCVSAAPRLAALEDDLSVAGVGLVLLAVGGADGDRGGAAAFGLRAPIRFPADGNIGPLWATGTPSAYAIGSDGRLLTDAVVGSSRVVRLAAELAGAELTERSGPGGGAVRYLPASGGACAAGASSGPTAAWTRTQVHRVGAFHVGINVDHDATGALLDALLPGTQVEDPRADPSFALALPGVRPGPERGLRRLDQLDRPGGLPPVRSRHPGRVLRALVADLAASTDLAEEHMGGADRGDALRVRAVAAVAEPTGDDAADRRAVLVPGAALVQAPGLQAALAARGIAVTDAPFLAVHPDSAEVSVVAASIPHDAAVLDALREPDGPRWSERPPVPVGRYRLAGWFTAAGGGPGALSPGRATGAVLHQLDRPDADAAARLGALFASLVVRPLPDGSAADQAAAVAAVLGGQRA